MEQEGIKEYENRVKKYLADYIKEMEEFANIMEENRETIERIFSTYDCDSETLNKIENEAMRLEIEAKRLNRLLYENRIIKYYESLIENKQKKNKSRKCSSDSNCRNGNKTILSD